ncbi:MAG: hypothetical protein MRY72_07440 [Aquisalinus sp.]|nr:hypothetical protein [Aquisalinus sp.]
MTKIEAIFGGVLLLAIVAAASFAVFQNGLPSIGTPAVALLEDGEANPAVFTGAYRDDMCTCYESGYQYGSEHGNSLGNPDYSIDNSVHYKAGFTACRTAVGFEGSSAWSEGWRKGEEGIRTQRRCNFYLKSLNIR